MIQLIHWLIVLAAAYFAGKLMAKAHMPAILGWLMAGMLLGPHALNIMDTSVMNATWYRLIIMWMQCGFGLMLGTELIWKKLKSYGKGLIVTTLWQSLGTFAVVSAAFGVIFALTGLPVWLGCVFGGIALATAPAPALSIVKEYRTRGPVTDTLLPMAVLDDVVGIAVFFTVNAVVTGLVSGGSLNLGVIPVMIFVPVLIGGVAGFITGQFLKKPKDRDVLLATLCIGITATVAIGWCMNTYVMKGIALNYTLMGVAFAAVFSNMVSEAQLVKISKAFNGVLSISLLACIADLGAPLDWHLIGSAGIYTAVYIIFRAVGKCGGAAIGAKLTKLPSTVQKYLGLTLLPHSGVSLVFTGIICTTLASRPELVGVVQGTIAAAAVINEFIAVFAARKGFELAGEIGK